MRIILFLIIILQFMACANNVNQAQLSQSTEINTVAKEEYVQQANEDETDSIFHYVRAHRYLELNNIKAAESRFQKVTELEPNFARAWLGLAEVAYLNDQMDKSDKYIDKAIKLKPDLGEAVYHKAKLKKELGECKESIRIIESSTSSNFPPLNSLLALCKGLIGDHSSAEILFNDSFINIEEFKNIILNQAEYTMSVGKYEESLKLANDYLNIHQSPEAYILKGMILVELGLTDEALELFEDAKLMSSNPKVPLFYNKAKEMILINSD